MARTSTQKTAVTRKGGKAAIERNYKNYRDTLLEWSERPAVKYVAGGIGLALLGRIAFSMSDRYPEIARFFRENIDTVEGKLREFRGIESESADARH